MIWIKVHRVFGNLKSCFVWAIHELTNWKSSKKQIGT